MTRLRTRLERAEAEAVRRREVEEALRGGDIEAARRSAAAPQPIGGRWAAPSRGRGPA